MSWWKKTMFLYKKEVYFCRFIIYTCRWYVRLSIIPPYLGLLTIFFFFFFFLKWTFVHFLFFVRHMSYFGATGTPVLDFWWRLLWVSKPEWVLPYTSHCGGECNVHSRRSTSGATRCRPLDGKHCGALTRFISCPRILLAPVRLEPAIKRSCVLRANHSATRPGQASLQLHIQYFIVCLTFRKETGLHRRAVLQHGHNVFSTMTSLIWTHSPKTCLSSLSKTKIYLS